nr:PREDICTED: uncharacterized protein LOC109037544 [Bemisia tabaci]
MYTRVERLLQQVGLPGLLDKFKESFFDDEALPCVTCKEDLSGIVPMGLALRFFDALKKDRDDPQGSRSTLDSLNSSSSEAVTTPSPSSSSSPVTLFNSTSADNLISPDFHVPISELTPVVIENIVETEAFANSPTPTPTLTPLPASTPDPPTLSQNIQQDPPARQEKILSITSSASLNDALKKYDKGKLVLKAYEKSQCLEKKFSLMLCDIILLHEFDGNPNTYLSTKQFASLTKSITELFPNEKAESYFIPNRTVNGSMVRARGRLLDKYENRLKAFRGVGLIGSRRQKTSAQVPLETSAVAGPEQASLDWLRLNHEPLDAVEKHWILTHQFRFNALLNDSNTLVHDYYEQYPFLRVPENGIRLIERDFKLLYPQAENNFIDFWGEVAEKILILAKAKYEKEEKFRTHSSQALISETDLHVKEAEKRKVLALVLLPLLFSAPGNVNRNKRGIVPWKPSKQDCVNGFIFRSPDSCSYEDRLLEKKNFLATRKIAFQPITVAVGTLDNFSQSLVVIDDIKYSFKSVLEAFVFCFKSYFALNAQYPVECGSSYSFIQQHVFKIDIKSNSKSYRAVNDLINSLNCISASDSSSS